MVKNKNRFCGIDVGIKESYAAILEDNRLISILRFEDIEEAEELFSCHSAGIDAPLSYPMSGNLRECEKKLLKMGIRLFPSGAEFFRDVAEKGMKIAKVMSERGVKVFEVYPYATRYILKIAPQSKKFKRTGRREIMEKLKKFVTAVEWNFNHNEIDAIIAALTVFLYYGGGGRILSGPDGSLLIPG